MLNKIKTHTVFDDYKKIREVINTYKEVMQPWKNYQDVIKFKHLKN